jgi:nicotinamide/nicotinate riboside kinase
MTRVKLVALSGCTNGGKTTLAKQLLRDFPRSTYLTQDNFYFPRDEKHLIYIPELDSFNFDVISAIDMNALHEELQRLIHTGSYDYIFIDGFLLYEDEKLYAMLDRKYFLYLTYEECLRRRMIRHYNSIDTPNYFEKCVWVEYLKYREKCEQKYQNDIVYLDGSRPAKDVYDFVSNDILQIN